MSATILSAGEPLRLLNLRYGPALRCIGQFLEATELKAIEVKARGDLFIVQAWHRGISSAMDMERQFSQEDLKRMDGEAREKRKSCAGPPNPTSISQVLRLAGNYVDRMGGRLLRVSWQDQSDKIQSLTVQWEAQACGEIRNVAQMKVVEELCIHIYKQRKKINFIPEKSPHRAMIGAIQPE